MSFRFNAGELYYTTTFIDSLFSHQRAMRAACLVGFALLIASIGATDSSIEDEGTCYSDKCPTLSSCLCLKDLSPLHCVLAVVKLNEVSAEGMDFKVTVGEEQQQEQKQDDKKESADDSLNEVVPADKMHQGVKQMLVEEEKRKSTQLSLEIP